MLLISLSQWITDKMQSTKLKAPSCSQHIDIDEMKDRRVHLGVQLINECAHLRGDAYVVLSIHWRISCIIAVRCRRLLALKTILWQGSWCMGQWLCDAALICNRWTLQRSWKSPGIPCKKIKNLQYWALPPFYIQELCLFE